MDEKHLGWKGLWMENSNSNPSRQEGRDEKLLEWRIPLLIHIVESMPFHPSLPWSWMQRYMDECSWMNIVA
jgi:hypothetical protein